MICCHQDVNVTDCAFAVLFCFFKEAGCPGGGTYGSRYRPGNDRQGCGHHLKRHDRGRTCQRSTTGVQGVSVAHAQIYVNMIEMHSSFLKPAVGYSVGQQRALHSRALERNN